MSLRVFTLDYFPWVTVKNVNGTMNYGGALVDFLVYVAKSAKIKFSFLQTQNQTLGKGVSWTSLTNLLAKGEADLILLPYLITEDRLKKFSFSAEIYYVRVGILSGKPSKKGIDSFAQLFPFTLEVFFVFVLLLWAISVITKCSEYVYLLRTAPEREGHHQQRPPSVSKCAWSFFAAFFSEEGTPLSLSSTPSKLVASTWWLSIIVLTSLVSGTMKAKYTVSVDIRIDSVQDVINSPYIRPLIRKGTAYEEYFQNSEESLKRQVWLRASEMGGLISTGDMENNLSDIVNGNSVLITGHDDVPKLVSKFCTNSRDPSLESAFYLSGKSIFWQAVGLPLRRGIATRFKETLDDK